MNVEWMENVLVGKREKRGKLSKYVGGKEFGKVFRRVFDLVWFKF